MRPQPVFSAAAAESAVQEAVHNAPAEASAEQTDAKSWIARMQKSRSGSWVQYDVLLASQCYGWNTIVEWAAYLESADFSGIQTITVSASVGAQEQELIEAYRQADCSIRNLSILSREAGVLGVGGISRELGAPVKFVWFNQTNVLRVFTFLDDDVRMRRYLEKAIGRAFD